jgi:hypothetical protein
MRSIGVNEVYLDSPHKCLQVEHDFPDPTIITDILSRELREWSVASNGEIEMLHTSPTLVESCKVHLPSPTPLNAAVDSSSPTTRRTIGEIAL